MFKRKYHHCGPFNSIKKRKSKTAIDESCRQHDIRYSKYGWKAYFAKNKADSIFIREQSKFKGWRPWMYRNYFRVKNKISPFTISEPSSSKKKQIMPYGKRSSGSISSGQRSRIRRSVKRVRRTLSLPSSSTRSGSSSAPPYKTKMSSGRSNTSWKSGFVPSSQGGSFARISTSSVSTVKAKSKKGAVKDKGVPNFVDGNVVSTSFNAFNKMSYPGYVYNYEVTGIQSGTNVVYISHTSCPQNIVLRSVASAWLKAIVRKALNWNVTDGSQTMPFSYTTSPYPVFMLGCQKIDNSSVEYIWNYTCVGTETFSTLALEFYTALFDWCSANSSTPAQYGAAFSQIKEWLIYPKGSGQMSFLQDMAHCTIDVTTECTLKIKNTCTGLIEGGTVLDVDNEPLVGKSYKCRGQAILIAGKNTPLFDITPDWTTGVKSGNDVTAKFSELPLKSTIIGCGKVGNIGLGPADIKTHIFSFKKSMNIQKFLEGLALHNSDVTTYPFNVRSKFGETALFGFEKHINNAAPIKLDYEHNIKVGSVFHLKPSYNSSQENLRVQI